MSGFPLIVSDASGVIVTIRAPARRVVSLVPSITESVVALGAVAVLVGRTRYCIHPAEAVRGIAKVGGTKDVDVAAVVGLKPDLVLANREENIAEQVAALRAAGLCVHVSEPRGPREALELVALLGRVLGREEAADRVVADGRAAIAECAGARRDLQQRDAIALIWNQPLMCAGGGTYIDDVLQALGLENVGATIGERYPEIPVPQIARLAPALILLPSEPYEWKERDADALAGLLRDTGGAEHHWRSRMVLCNGEDLMWFGTRTPGALRRLRAQLAAHISGADL